MAAPEPADLTLHPALLMRPLACRGRRRMSHSRNGNASPRTGDVRTVPDPTRPGSPPASNCHSGSSRSAPRRTPRRLAHAHPGTIPGFGWRSRNGTPSPNETAACKHVQLHHLPGDRGSELAEINLVLSGRWMGLRHHHLAPVGADLDPQPGNQSPDRGLPDLDAFLLHQPLPDPAGRCAAASAAPPILHQPPPNKINMQARGRRQPSRHIPRRRRRIRQRLTHRPPVHPMTLRQRPDGHSLVPRITSDTFKLLPLDLSFTPLPLRIAMADEPKVEGNSGSRVGPHRASTSPPSGAKSDWHTQSSAGPVARHPLGQ